tara:strand:+ start:1420 stop:1617 length:198 start_codon:yes stop_codon:yes gene_type:complete
MGNICYKDLEGERNILNIENFNELPYMEFEVPESPDTTSSCSTSSISNEILTYIDLDMPNSRYVY